MSYEMIDRFLRNNLCDDDYAEYSNALEALYKEARREALLDLAKSAEDSIDGSDVRNTEENEKLFYMVTRLRKKAKELE